jgi:hypothetical protein
MRGRLDEGQMGKAFLKSGGKFPLVVDATHPYAVEASRNIAARLRGRERARPIRGCCAAESEAERAVFFRHACPRPREAAGRSRATSWPRRAARRSRLYKMDPGLSPRASGRACCRPRSPDSKAAWRRGCRAEHVLTRPCGPFSAWRRIVRDLKTHCRSLGARHEGRRRGGRLPREGSRRPKTARRGSVYRRAQAPRRRARTYDEVFRDHEGGSAHEG